MSILTSIKHWLGIGELPPPEPPEPPGEKQKKHALELLEQFQQQRKKLLLLAAAYPYTAQAELRDKYHEVEKTAKHFMPDRPDLSELFYQEKQSWVYLWNQSIDRLQQQAKYAHAKEHHGI